MSAVPDRFNTTSAGNITTAVGYAPSSVPRAARLDAAIRNALRVLGEGGCPACKCAGCSAEMAEAHRILREALA